MKLSKKSISVIKLALWSAIVVWMVFFFAFGVIAAQWLASYGSGIYSGFGSEVFARVLHWIAPIWVVFTALLVCVAMAKFANKRLGRKEPEPTGIDFRQSELRTFIQQVGGVELTERDIKAVADARYMKKRQWYLLGGLFGAIVLMIPILVFLPVGNLLRLLILIPFAGWCVYAGLFLKGLSKYSKGLVKEWKE